MSRLSGSAFALGVALALAVVGVPAAAATVAASAGPAAASPRPALNLVAQRPRVAVRGVGFLPQETVRVTVLGATVVTGRATAAADGSFRLSLRRPAPLSCGRLLVRAAGARGSRAFLRLGPPECNPTGAAADAGNR